MKKRKKSYWRVPVGKNNNFKIIIAYLGGRFNVQQA